MEKMDEKVFEIDFAELFNCFKRKKVLILGTTIAMAFLVGFYILFLDNYRYFYIGTIECPRTMDYGTRLGYTSILRADISKDNLWKGEKKAKLQAVYIVPSTYLINLRFEGEDPEYLKQISDKYINEATKRLNKRFRVIEEKKYSDIYLKLVVRDIEYINAALSTDTVTAKGAIKFLDRLKKRLETEEKEKNILKMEAIIDPKKKAAKISNLKYIPIGALIGFFIVTGYIICQYCWRKLNE